ncbi:unnamed protein product [Calicophoron daubneyi]|uniref:RRM domain-containing protein n=1 Tax=Calicophoron daubneyi TaxID=300641 RepID=A0AAV2TFH7_CALDB
MVHVVQANPESPSLLTAKAVCQLNEANPALSLHGLSGLFSATAPSTHQQQPTAQTPQPVVNPCFLSLIPNMQHQLLRPEAWLTNTTIYTPCMTTTFNPAHRSADMTNEKIMDGQIAKTQIFAAQNPSGGGDDTKPSTEEKPPDSYHIFVGDLAPDIEDDVLLAAFSAFGNVVECKIIKDMHTQKPKGYGFVAYQTKQSWTTGGVDRSCGSNFNGLKCSPPCSIVPNTVDTFNSFDLAESALPTASTSSNSMKKPQPPQPSCNMYGDRQQIWPSRSVYGCTTDSEMSVPAVMLNATAVSQLASSCSLKTPCANSTLSTPFLTNSSLSERYISDAFSGASFIGQQPGTIGPALDRSAGLLSLASSLPCDLTAPLVQENLSLPLQTLQANLIALRSFASRPLLPAYSLINNTPNCQTLPNFALSTPIPTGKANTQSVSEQAGFSDTSGAQYTLPLRSPPFIQMPLQLPDLCAASSYACGVLPPELPNPSLLPGYSGVSLFC